MSEYYELYMKCFPDYPTDQETFQSVLRPEQAHIIVQKADEKLVGFAMVHGNSIPILCVDEEYRNHGIGSTLLTKAERTISALGYQKAVLGCGPHYLLQGVPEGPSVDLFKRRGYTAEWTSINMELDLSEFDPDKLSIPPAPEGLKYRFAEKSDLPALLKAVEAAESGWVSIFADCSDPILLAELDGKIAGFEILCTTGGYFTRPAERVGSVGCVGVVPDMRQRGIGMDMVAKGVQWLGAQGCTQIELRYTWLESWYGKLGFKTVSRQWMGEKEL